MDNTNSSLLPYILRTLSQKPELCDTYENLCQEIESILSSESVVSGYKNTQKAIDKALDVGQNLGILSVTDDLVRVPFNFNKGPKRLSASKKAVSGRRLSKAEEKSFIAQPRRTYNVRPNLVARGGRRRGGRSRRYRRSSRSRRR